VRVWRFAVYLLLPYAVARLVWRALRYPPYWRRWPERFGFVAPLGDRRTIWVHAVSVGEVRSAAALIAALGERYPRHRLVVTTMTPTGADQVRALLGERVTQYYVPFDFPGAVRRFFDRIHPELALIAETELWPNLFAECARRRVPLVLVNGRVSPESLRGYRMFPRLARATLECASLLCAQTRTDAQRLRNLGAPDERVRVTGNLKFDVAPPAGLADMGRELRAQWGRDRPVWIAASTRRGEERHVLAAFGRLRTAFPTLLLVLVPRHPERFGAAARLCRRRGWRVAERTRTRGAPLDLGCDVLVGDTMGELQHLYAAADVAFVGGSLVRTGGQNVLEACTAGVPAVFGPHMFHFEEIAALALERGAARQVHDSAQLAAAVALYLEQPELRRAAGRAAQALVADNRGALERTLEHIATALAREPLRDTRGWVEVADARRGSAR
jgi:3-deoxy-D-manno-octulosonic-acid transferase